MIICLAYNEKISRFGIDFDQKQPALFKKNSNSWFSGIYSKKLLTLYSHIRIMRTVRSEKATSKLRA
ncbi:hypothetical protein FKQ61_15405 [Vibrio sp. A14(2019)]|nr:hypothetical protein [Vibrio sp. A14(2019)]